MIVSVINTRTPPVTGSCVGKGTLPRRGSDPKAQEVSVQEVSKECNFNLQTSGLLLRNTAQLRCATQRRTKFE